MKTPLRVFAVAGGLAVLSFAILNHLRLQQTDAKLADTQEKLRRTEAALKQRNEALAIEPKPEQASPPQHGLPSYAKQDTASGPTQPASTSTAIAAVPTAASPEDAQLTEISERLKRRAREFARYGPFLKERGVTSDRIERYIDLSLEKENTRLDVQEMVREKGVSGNSPDIQKLRDQLNAPLEKEMTDILGGPEGRRALTRYDIDWFYREGFVNPILPLFEMANLPLGPSQITELTALVAANQRSYKARPTDISNSLRIDWPSVAQQASATSLSPEQVEVLRSAIVSAGRK